MNRQDRRRTLKEIKSIGGTPPLDNIEGIYFAAQNFRRRARDLFEEYMILGDGINIDASARQMMSLYDLTYSSTNLDWVHIAETFKKFKAHHPITTEWLAIAYWYLGEYELAYQTHLEARRLDQAESFPWIKDNDKWFSNNHAIEPVIDVPVMLDTDLGLEIGLRDSDLEQEEIEKPQLFGVVSSPPSE